MLYTDNYNLNLPEKNEQFNIEHFNDNSRAIDEQLKINSNDIDTVNERLLEEIKDRESVNDTLQSNIDVKLNKNQGSSNKGKVMEVSDDGELKPSGLYRKTYTSLAELGLTADATVEEVVNALKNGENFIAPVNTFTNYETLFPNKLPNDQWNKIHITKGTSLSSSHIRCFSQGGTFEYLANINNTNVVGWNNVSGAYTDISNAIVEKLGNEILKYPVGKYRINSTTIGDKFTDLPSNAQMKIGLIEINGTSVGKSPFTDAWVYRMYKFECMTGSSVYTRRLNSNATAGQIEVDTDWRKIQTDEDLDTTITKGSTNPPTSNAVYEAIKSDYDKFVYICESSVSDFKKAIIVSNIFNVAGDGSVTIPTGSRLTVCFRNGNTALTPQLQVFDNGKNIVKTIVCNDFGTEKKLDSDYGSAISGACEWGENLILDLYYNGSNWVVMGNPVVKRWVDATNIDGVYPATSYRRAEIHINGLKKQYIMCCREREAVSIPFLTPFTNINYSVVVSAGYYSSNSGTSSGYVILSEKTINAIKIFCKSRDTEIHAEGY